MEITKTMTFPAPVATVQQMLLDQAFHQLVGAKQEALTQNIVIDRHRIRATRTFTAHDSIVAFVGPTLEIIEDTEWPTETQGNMVISISDAPVHYVGVISLLANGDETVAEFHGELSVKIPIIGRSLENKASKVVDLALDAFHSAAIDYLSR